MKVVIFKSKTNGQWYFHVTSKNNKIIAQSEGYKRKSSAVKTACKLFHSSIPFELFTSKK
jgi:Domain of unknown function (DUF1508).